LEVRPWAQYCITCQELIDTVEKPRRISALEVEMTKNLYMVIENFKNRDAAPVYRRFREQGRLMPAGLNYVSSWVHDTLDRCYQLVETEDRSLLDEWMTHWNDIIDFEIYPVITSHEASQRVATAV
jgi:Protein of unknown function (DUF3303)